MPLFDSKTAVCCCACRGSKHRSICTIEHQTTCNVGADDVGATCNATDPTIPAFTGGFARNATCRLPGPDDEFPAGVGGSKTNCRWCNGIVESADELNTDRCPNGACDCCPDTQIGDLCVGVVFKAPPPYGVCSDVGGGISTCLRCGGKGNPCCSAGAYLSALQ
jgi:hypothetical protein